MSDLLVVGTGMDMVVIAVDSKSTLENRGFAIAMNRNSCPASLCPPLSSDALDKDGTFKDLVVLPLYRLNRSYSAIGSDVSNGEVVG